VCAKQVVGSEHCSYSLDGTLLTLDLDAAHDGVEAKRLKSPGYGAFG
jgi:hypothetical protein